MFQFNGCSTFLLRAYILHVVGVYNTDHTEMFPKYKCLKHMWVARGHLL